MTPTEIQNYIGNNLTPEALEWWNGCSQEVIDELVVHSQVFGVNKVITMIEKETIL